MSLNCSHMCNSNCVFYCPILSLIVCVVNSEYIMEKSKCRAFILCHIMTGLLLIFHYLLKHFESLIIFLKDLWAKSQQKCLQDTQFLYFILLWLYVLNFMPHRLNSWSHPISTVCLCKLDVPVTRYAKKDFRVGSVKKSH